MYQVNYEKYIKVEPGSKKQSAQLTSSNSIVGDLFKLKIDSKSPAVAILNKFNYAVVKISEEDSKIIKL